MIALLGTIPKGAKHDRREERPMSISQHLAYDSIAHQTNPPVMVCMLGRFCLLKDGHPITMRSGGKIKSLLSSLALRQEYALPRESLLSALWPDSDTALACQSLNSLIHHLHRLLGDELGGAMPVTHADDYYRLNVEAGVGLDIALFDTLVAAGDRQLRAGNNAAALELFNRAIPLYRGDLCTSADTLAIVERERLRASFLNLLARLADHHFEAGDYSACLDYALRLLSHDPCREDAHRLVMRCYVRRGERAQALRQYRLCERVLQTEFSAVPEPTTQALFEQVRLNPIGI
jgi:DNA-binding SARP family transcriptional activator